MIKALYRIVIDDECWDRETETPQLPQLDTHEKFRIIVNSKKLNPFKIDEIFEPKETWHSHIVWFKGNFSREEYKKIPLLKEYLIKRIEECGWIKIDLKESISENLLSS